MFIGKEDMRIFDADQILKKRRERSGRICKLSHLKAETQSYYIFKALDPALDLALSRIQT